MSTQPNTASFDGLSPAVWDTIEDWVVNDPLKHPLSFQLRHFDYPYAPPDHLIDVEAHAFDAIHPAREGPNRLVRIMPREHGKSEIGSHLIPSWAALRNPNIRILLLSESEGQAAGKLKQCQSTIERLAPHYGRKVETNNKTALTLARDEEHDVPTIKAAGMTTGLTGGHFDLVVMDDIVSWDTQRTEKRREKQWKRFQDYLNLGTQDETTFLILGTRKHPNDIYSQLPAHSWDIVVEKAVSDFSVIENREFKVKTNKGNVFAGDNLAQMPPDETKASVIPERDVPVLWPERWPLSSLINNYLDAADEDSDYGSSAVWERENQNNPHALMGEILGADMLHTVETLPKDKSQFMWFVGVDVAVVDDAEKAATGDTDYWAVACVAWDTANDVYYVDRVRRTRGIGHGEAAKWLEGIVSDYPTPRVWIEGVQSQMFFVQECRDQGLHPQETQTNGAKEDRIQSMSGRFENGKVKLVAPNGLSSDAWKPFRDEWIEFPSGDHDDLLDAVCMALNAKGEMDEEKTKTSTRPFV